MALLAGAVAHANVLSNPHFLLAQRKCAWKAATSQEEARRGGPLQPI